MKKYQIIITTLITGFLGTGIPGFAQAPTFQPTFQLECWILNPTYSSSDAPASNYDIFLRRMRFGGKGNINERVKYNFSLAADRLGINDKSPAGGKYNGVTLWRAYITTRVIKRNDLLYLQAGHFWIISSRESGTSPWFVPSLDKSAADARYRTFYSGTGKAIENGVALGGNYHRQNLGFMYRTGIYYPEKYFMPGKWHPLLSARSVFILGEPEQTKYTFLTKLDPFKKRKGISLGVAGTYQAETDNKLTGSDTIYFNKNFSYGFDLLAEYNGFSLQTEYHLLRREFSVGEDQYKAHSWLFRIYWNKLLREHFCLQPTIMCSGFSGDGNRFANGDNEMMDIGINAYPKSKFLRLGFHYILQRGELIPYPSDYFTIQFQLVI